MDAVQFQKKIDEARAEASADNAFVFWILMFLIGVVVLPMAMWSAYRASTLAVRIGQLERSRRACTKIDVGAPDKSDPAWLCRDVPAATK